MKKVITGAMLTIMAFSLCSCGAKDKKPAYTPPTTPPPLAESVEIPDDVIQTGDTIVVDIRCKCDSVMEESSYDWTYYGQDEFTLEEDSAILYDKWYGDMYCDGYDTEMGRLFVKNNISNFLSKSVGDIVTMSFEQGDSQTTFEYTILEIK